MGDDMGSAFGDPFPGDFDFAVPTPGAGFVVAWWFLRSWADGDGEDGLERPLLANLARELRAAAERSGPETGGTAYLVVGAFLAGLVGKMPADLLATHAVTAYDAARLYAPSPDPSDEQIAAQGARGSKERRDARVGALVRALHEGLLASGFTEWMSLHDATAGKPEAERYEVAARVLDERLAALVEQLESPPSPAG
jgi:hypothetical protein